MKTSSIFDIKRFAIHDGYGIRTTVFFKGCPLKCRWCQNPEGFSYKPQPIYLQNKCIHCHLCEKHALPGQMHYDERPYFHREYQGDFDNLVKICPSSAIQYDSYPYTIHELFDKIKKDQVFFREDGGVTFSGGEPLMQGQFLIDILRKCKNEGIHTAIESSFYAPLEYVKEVVPYLDLIYCDLKVFDEQRHQELTGVSSKMIKENITYLLTSEYKDKVIIRTPLIPTMNATDENIKQITQFLVELYADVRYELLNYNPLASSKYDLVDLKYTLNGIKPYTKEDMEHFYQIVRENNLKNIIKE